jgi:hypothetical protein
MLFRRSCGLIDDVQLDELRRQDASRALEKECRQLRRKFAVLEKDNRQLRSEHEFQSRRIDAMDVQARALLTLINSLSYQEGSVSLDKRLMKRSASEGYESGNKDLIDDRAAILRRNAELELQVSSVTTQFGSLVTDYEYVCSKLNELKSAVSCATSFEELAGWEQL